MVRQRLEDLNRQVGLLTEVVGRRLAQPLDLQAESQLGDALATVAGLVPVPVTASVAAGLRAPFPACELQVLLLVALSNAAESGAAAGRPDRAAGGAHLRRGSGCRPGK